MAYFHSYAHVGIHEEMIKGRVRIDTYRAAIMEHQSFIEGKVVMDVGCGTGILSIFCAQAGAKRVYAVDASDIALQANEVVKANNLVEKVIVLHGRVANEKPYILTLGNLELSVDSCIYLLRRHLCLEFVPYNLQRATPSTYLALQSSLYKIYTMQGPGLNSPVPT